MVEIKPFRGVRYNAEKVGDISRVITAPYDVISDEQQQAYYDRSPYNIIRAVLGKDESGDSSQNKYEKAGQFIHEWVKEGVLKEEEDSCIYVYSQTFTVGEQELVRSGFIALGKMVKFGDGIFPHEKTLSGPLVDRMKLLEATKTQVGQIFVMYNDREKQLDTILEQTMAQAPLEAPESQDGMGHRLWKITDPDIIRTVTESLGAFDLVIADGHHRYTTALKYAEENPDNQAAQYRMMTFVNSFSDGLIVLPTNKVLHNLGDVDMGACQEKLKKFFEIEETTYEGMKETLASQPTLVDKESNLKNHLFGLQSTIDGKFYMLKLRDPNILDKYIPEETDVFKKLDVTIVHKIIIDEVMGVNEEVQRDGNKLKFVKGNEETFELMKNPKYQFAIYIRPPMLREVYLTALAGETMPQKATYFYPKVWTGVVLHPFFPVSDVTGTEG